MKAGDTEAEAAASAASAFCWELLWMRWKRKREAELRAESWGEGVVLRMRAPDNLFESVLIIRSRNGGKRDVDNEVGIAVLVRAQDPAEYVEYLSP